MNPPDIIILPPKTPPLLPIEKTGAGFAMGRIFYSMVHLSKVILDVAIKIINAIFSLFCSYRFKLYSEQAAKPLCLPADKLLETPLVSPNRESPISNQKISTPARSHESLKNEPLQVPVEPAKKSDKTDEAFENKEALDYLTNKGIRSENDQTKMDQMFHWVLDHAEDSPPSAKQMMQEFIADFAKKSETEEMKHEGSYIRWIERLSPKKVTAYAQLLYTEGNPPPLFYHLKKEHQAAQLTGKSSSDRIGDRLKLIFSTFTPLHAHALTNCDDFWNLVYKFPEQAAESLQADVLAIIGRNKKRHKTELKMLVPRLPEDGQLFHKLNAIAPHTSDQIEQELKFKAERLLHFDYAVQESILATKEQKKTLRNQVVNTINLGLKNHHLEMQKLADDKKSDDSKKSSKPPAKKWAPVGQKQPGPKAATITNPVIKPKPLWPDAQCLSFLKEKVYKDKADTEAEDIVFDWILNREHLFDDDCHRLDFIAFIEFTLSKPLYIETTLERLQLMSPAQFLFFLKLLGRERIEIYWHLESKFIVALSHEQKKISRLKTAIAALSEEQFQTSIQVKKFLELLRNYPKFLGPVLTSDRWGIMAAQLEREKDILLTLTQLVAKADPDDDREIPEKLRKISHLAKSRPELPEKEELRQALKREIEMKLILCPSVIRKEISAALKEDADIKKA